MNPDNYLYLSALLFTIGASGVLLRRNAIIMFMCVELMLNAANLAFVSFSRMHGQLDGQVVAFFTMVVAACEVVVGLAITIWNRVFKMGRTGQSVGKKVIGLYLLDDKTGQPIGAGMCFLREVVQTLVNQVFYLGWLWMLWDADRQTLGDKAVHSSVVVVPKG